MTIETEIRNFFDIPIEHFPDRSTRWLFQEKENVRGLVEIVANELAELIDFNQLTQLNRSFVSDALREQESDIVFRVPFHRGAEADELLIYILIEHQSTVDATMGFRVLFYMTQIWDSQRQEWKSKNVPKSEWRLRPILPIVFYTGLQRWNTPLTLNSIMDIPDVLSRFVPTFDTLFLNVKETDAANFTRPDHPIGWLLTVLQKENADTREVETMAQSIIELSEKRGETRAKQAAVLKLLQIRFDPVPESFINEVTSIRSLSRLDSLFERVATAQTLDEIEL